MDSVRGGKFDHDGSVFVPDLPGFGLSGRPARVLTAEQHAEVIAAGMDTAEMSGAQVLGNSFGCQIAVELAIRRRDLVASLTLVGPTAAPTAVAQVRRTVRHCRFRPFRRPGS